MSGISHDEAPPPPPAPPLPPQRYGHRAANALARFAQPFIYASRPPSAYDNQPSESKTSNLRPNAQRSLSLPSRTIAHKTGIPIASLDVSPLRTHVVLAGRDILKTVQVSDSTCTEEYNLRSAIIAHTAAHGSSGNVASARHRDQIIATDVKWSHDRYDTTIATAAANGQIVLYDINRPGVELARLHEHSRQVHRVAFNPFEGALLLSGSQDATIRLWDLRALVGDRSVMTCTSRYTYPGNSEGIRDLRWSPTNGVEFAACTDNGAVQRWDFTKLNAPLLKINAHEKTCHSIDWHPDGKHLASAGADKNIKIWDFSSTDRRMKACWQLRAPRPVLNLRWRPSSWYSDHHGLGNWECTHLATSYNNQDPRLHVWDLCRPSIPFREVNLYDTAPTAMLWHSENLLWSVGNTGMFAQTDINFSTNIINKRSVSSIAIAPDGNIALFSEKRSHRRTSIDDPSSDYLHRNRGARNSTEKLSSSYSATDGSLEEPSLLTSSFKHRRRKVPSTRSSRSLASTPPSAGTGGTVINLEDAMQQDKLHHLAQVAACGPISGVADAEQFRFLACHYRFPSSLEVEKVTYDIHQDLFETFEYNAKCAAYTGQYRLAQSWKIIAFATRGELETRANRNREKRLQDAGYRDIDSDRSPLPQSEDTRQLAESGGKDESFANDKSVRSGLAVPAALEYGSNMATPIAKPQPDLPIGHETWEQPPVLEESQSLQLPEPAFDKRSPPKQAGIASGLTALRNSQEKSAFQSASQRSPPLDSDTQAHNQTITLPDLHNVDGNLHERRATMENYRAPPRPVLRLEDSFQMSGSNALPRFDRHYSDESFQMFSVSTNSSHRTKSVGGSFDSSLESTRSDLAIEQWNNSSPHERSDENFHVDGTSRQDDSPSASFSTSNYQPVGELSTSIDNHPPTLHHSILPEPPIVHYNDFKTEDSTEDHFVPEPNILTDHKYIESDFIPHAPDVRSPPWSATAMLCPLFEYHLHQLSDTQLPSCLIFHLEKYIDLNIPSNLIISVLLSYHDQLVSQSLYVEASHVRMLAWPSYPEVTDYGTFGVTIGGAWCTVCSKPSKGDRGNFCNRCKQDWAPCPVCHGEGPLSLSNPVDRESETPHMHASSRGENNLWYWCQECGHGGHTGCLRVWWDDTSISEGGCATIGCLHDCVAGTRRAELLRRLAEKKKPNVVKSDRWIVGESRAVERTRGLVGVGDGTEAPILQSQNKARSPLRIGTTGRTGSRGKKVRLLVPEGEEGREQQSNGKVESRTSASVP